MRRQREAILEFRTPQHPSEGTNNWGGASPLLARNIPKESLEQKYTKLNSVRTKDEVYPNADECFDRMAGAHASKKGHKRKGLIFELIFRRRRGKTVTLGSRFMKKWRLPRLDRENRWPNGWC